MYIKKSVSFVLHARRKKDSVDGKDLMIRMRVSFNGNTPIDFSTGHVVNAKDWNKEEQRVKAGVVNSVGQTSRNINRTLDEFKNVADEAFARYELIEKRIPERSEVKDLINDLLGRATKVNEQLKQNDFFAVYDKFQEVEGGRNQWSKAIYKKFRVIKKHLINYDSDLSFSTLNYDKMKGFCDYLICKKKLSNVTTAKYISFLRWFLRWSAQNKYYFGNAHETFKPKLKGVNTDYKEIIYLTIEELKRMESFDFSNNTKLEQVRDVFVFCCFTGLRYSDVRKLKRSDIKDGYIDVVTKKTTDNLRIELNKHSKAILDKYKNKRFPKDLALPVISNQKMNDYIKEVARICEINEPVKDISFIGNERVEETKPKWQVLSSHAGRRTFVVTALQQDIPIEVIKEWTGHKDYKAMKPYIKIVNSVKQKQMKKFNDV